MNALAAIRDPTWLPSAGRRPLADTETVQGVVVERPRDSIVAVRVEVVNDASERPNLLQPAAAQAREGSQSDAREAALLLARLETPQAAEKLGSPDARRAAAAYSAQSDWHGYGEGRQANTSAPPALLSLRA